MPVLLTIYLLCSLVLVLYGLHHYFIIALFLRAKNKISQPLSPNKDHINSSTSPTENATPSNDSTPSTVPEENTTPSDASNPSPFPEGDTSQSPGLDSKNPTLGTPHPETTTLKGLHKTPHQPPHVLTQIPLYNEANVAERVIRAVANIDYPKHLHTIQVLDDSNDHTIQLVDKIVHELASQGHQITAIRRTDRSGYKAGALDYGLTLCDAPYITIFDSDFIPPTNFLTETIPHLLENEHYGLVQARWGFLNENDSPFTKAQSVGIDGHFVIEQTARSYNDYFLNFNGTAGVWRRTAIEDAGGWNADTLTEDLDLSYRAQLKGWKFHYLPHLVVPAEIPPSYAAFRSQQFRWAKGSMQTAVKILPKIWTAKIPLRKKIEATFHLTHYSIHLCMFIHALLGLPIALTGADPFGHFVATWYLAPLGLAMLGPSLLYLTAEVWIKPDRWTLFLKRLPMLLLIGFGICLSNARACIEGIIGIKSPFVRTPKQGDGKITYRTKSHLLPILELSLGIYSLITAYTFYKFGIPAAAPFFLIYAAGFLLFATRSFAETRTPKKTPLTHPKTTAIEGLKTEN